MNRRPFTAGFDAHHHAHDKENQEKGEEILVENGAETGPGGKLGEAEPGGIDSPLKVVHTKRGCDNTADYDSYGDGHEVARCPSLAA